MKKYYKFILFLVFTFFCGFLYSQQASSLSGEEILKKVDDNYVYDTIKYNGIMEIDLGKRKLKKEMQAVASGTQNAFVEFTNPEDRGTRYLKINKDLWIYFPSEQQTVKISGHLLKEGMMGSDVSYEDALESGSLADKYSITLLPDEKVDNRNCHVLDLNAKVKNVPYERQKLWVDAERFVVLKREMYAKNGKLLKESKTLAVKQFGTRWFATEVFMEDKIKKGGGTTFIMTNVEFGIELPADQFNMRRLGR